MAGSMSAKQVLDREFLELRCKILDLAASFDRLQRESGQLPDDPRVARLREALEILFRDTDDRAESVQLHFSRVYSSQWREEFQLDRSAGVKAR